MKHFGYSEGDYIPSEYSGLPCQDIHHIDCKGMGGSKEKDYIENLMGLTRREHDMWGDKKEYMDFLIEVHKSFLKTKVPWLVLHPPYEQWKKKTTTL